MLAFTMPCRIIYYILAPALLCVSRIIESKDALLEYPCMWTVYCWSCAVLRCAVPCSAHHFGTITDDNSSLFAFVPIMCINFLLFWCIKCAPPSDKCIKCWCIGYTYRFHILLYNLFIFFVRNSVEFRFSPAIRSLHFVNQYKLFELHWIFKFCTKRYIIELIINIISFLNLHAKHFPLRCRCCCCCCWNTVDKS